MFDAFSIRKAFGAAWLAFFLSMLLAMPARAELQLTIHPDHYAAAIDDPLQAEQNIDNIPGNASFADDSQWSDRRGTNVKDITDYIPGVIDQPRDGAESNRLSIRGSGLANIFQGTGLLVLQDGIPLNMADGEFEFPVIDPWLTRYAEIYPGANAMSLGDSTFGGAINFISPNGGTDNGYDLRGEAGSFRTLHGLASDGRQWDGGDLFAAVDGFSQEGFRDQNAQNTSRFSANWGEQIGDNFDNRVYLDHTHSDAQIPGAITLADTRSDPRMANPTNSAENYQRDLDITRIADKGAWTSGAGRIDASIFYTYRRLDNPVTTYEFQNSNDTGLRASYTHSYGEDRKSDWLVGVNAYYGDAGEERYRNNDAVPGALVLTRKLYAFTNETYGQIDQQLVGRLYGIVSVQESYAMRDIDQGYPAVAHQDKGYSGFSPRIGLRYDIDDKTRAFSNLSRSFEPPTWSQLSGGNNPGFADLKAQKATTAEIGARGQYQAMHWQMAYYHAWLRDEFVNYEFASGETATINAPRTKKDGVELGLNGDARKNIWLPEDAVNVRVAYTFSHFTLDRDPLYGKNTLPGVPEHYLRAEALYRHPSGVSFGPNIEWSPAASPVDLTNTLYAPGYAIFGARVFWASEDQRLNFYIEGANLLNHNYVATYNVVPNASGHDGPDFYPGEGRAIYAGVRWKL